MTIGLLELMFLLAAWVVVAIGLAYLGWRDVAPMFGRFAELPVPQPAVAAGVWQAPDLRAGGAGMDDRDLDAGLVHVPDHVLDGLALEVGVRLLEEAGEAGVDMALLAARREGDEGVGDEVVAGHRGLWRCAVGATDAILPAGRFGRVSGSGTHTRRCANAGLVSAP